MAVSAITNPYRIAAQKRYAGVRAESGRLSEVIIFVIFFQIIYYYRSNLCRFYSYFHCV